MQKKNVINKTYYLKNISANLIKIWHVTIFINGWDDYDNRVTVSKY